MSNARSLGEGLTVIVAPTGEVRRLPPGSTPVDLAYALGRSLRDRCIAARVNNRLARLDRRLVSGDRVEIVTTSVPCGPSPRWLAFARTAGARGAIRRWLPVERSGVARQ